MYKQLVSILLILVILTPVSFAGAKQTTSLTLEFENNKCRVFFWVNINGERKRIDYYSKSETYVGQTYCLIKIPAKEFDSYFEYCSLSGISTTSEKSNMNMVQFAGGSHQPDNKYFFEWRDAKHFFPSYMCIGSK